MTEVTQTSTSRTTRAEKLRAIAAVFGEATAARLGAGSGPMQDETPDDDRLAWQKNRLIRHLRDRIDAGDPQDEPARQRRTDPESVMTGAAGKGQARTGMGRPATTARVGLSRLPGLIAGEDLAAEHPAVIARILADEPQQIRVSVLRALPGQVARAVMQRLRTG